MLARFASDERGATAIEYVLIASLIAMAIVFGYQSLAGSVGDSLENTAAQFPDPPDPE